MEYIIYKKITSLDIVKALKGKVNLENITIEEDDNQIKIILPDNIELTEDDKISLKNLIPPRAGW